ncbi:MAG: hypothetical protein PHS54_04435 [Clostridia bacterium]|nr:hypothetical protein [Clostridia bacterium]
MEILREIKQIEDKLNKIFNFKEQIDIEKFVKTNLTEEELNSLVENIGELSKDYKILDDFSDLIFQLRNYSFALNNFIRLLLIKQNFEAVFHFVRKIFVGQIGQIKYVSNKEVYNYLERYFDRFIEIVKDCNIEKNLYLPLILKAFESEKTESLFTWKRPAIEFMQNFFNENEAWTLDYINSNIEDKYKILEMITDFNTARGIKMLIDDFISENNLNEELNTHILKKYKRETFLELDKRLLDTISDDVRERIACVFLSFGKDNEALTRLKDMYDRASNESLRTIIAERLEIMESPDAKSEKQFLYAARRKVKEPQERTLGLPFNKFEMKLKSGFEAENVAITYLINLFKEEKNLNNLKNLEYLKNIFDENDLNNFSSKLFDILKEKTDIKEAKWAIRMISLFSQEPLTESLVDFASNLFSLGREKEAKYLTECLTNSGKIEILKLFPDIKETENITPEWKNEIFVILSKKSKINIEDLNDQLAIGQTDDIEKQKNRLFEAFINNRKYNNKNFDILSSSEPFKSLFEKLIWGEYKNGRLYNAFILENGKRVYKVKLLDDEQSNFEISILHTLDIDDRFEKIIDSIKDPLFEQFKHIKFDSNDFKQQVIEISNFSGMFVSTKDFVDKLQENGFVINKDEDEKVFTSLININKDLNTSCILEFNKPIILTQAYSNLGNIYFVKFSDLIKDNEKYIYSKLNAISAKNLPARYFDYCMTSILKSAQ